MKVNQLVLVSSWLNYSQKKILNNLLSSFIPPSISPTQPTNLPNTISFQPKVKVEVAVAKPTLPTRLAQSLFIFLHTGNFNLKNQQDNIFNLLLVLLNMLALLHNVPNSLQTSTHSANPSSGSMLSLLRLDVTM